MLMELLYYGSDKEGRTEVSLVLPVLKIFIDALHNAVGDLFLVAGGIKLPVFGSVAHKSALQDDRWNLRPVDGGIIIGPNRRICSLPGGL